MRDFLLRRPRNLEEISKRILENFSDVAVEILPKPALRILLKIPPQFLLKRISWNLPDISLGIVVANPLDLC